MYGQTAILILAAGKLRIGLLDVELVNRKQ